MYALNMTPPLHLVWCHLVGSRQCTFAFMTLVHKYKSQRKNKFRWFTLKIIPADVLRAIFLETKMANRYILGQCCNTLTSELKIPQQQFQCIEYPAFRFKDG